MGGASEDDFGQFLDLSGMADGMQFDFHGFEDGSAQAMMARPRNQADGMMTADSVNQNMMTQNPGMMHSQGNHPMSNTPAGAHSAGPGPMVPTSVAQAPGSESISSIDAQIQYLQQQKFQQQQRQLQEQRNAYFTSHSVPPTPQSLEMPPGSGNFYSQHEMYDRNYHHQQRLKEQQDVSSPLI